MARPPATVEYLQRLVTWAGGNAAFCEKSGIKQPNLSSYLNQTKNISWKRLESATAKVFGGPPVHIEYLRQLVTWAGGNAAFCKQTGIQQSNLSDYLNGNKNISWKRLRTATAKVFGEPPAFQPITEGYDVETNGLPTLAVLPKEPGIYALFDSAMRVIYYGKATSLYAEARQTLGRHVAEVRPWTGAKNLTFKSITKYLSAYRILRSDSTFVHDIEAFGLKILVNNTFNKNGAKFKRSQ